MARHTLSCCIVVKNEEKRIKSCLDRITILADEIIIVDTGSTDKTCDVISMWVNQKKAQKGVKLVKVGNRFHDEDGDFDFGGAKHFALQQARGEYVMWLDAADEVSEQAKVKKAFIEHTNKNPNCYFVMPTTLAKKFAFNRARIGPKKFSVMDGRIHETMRFTNEDILERIFIPIPIKNAKTNRNENLGRNIRILEKDWKKNKTGRNCFTIANTYRSMNRIKESLEWFRKRVYMFKFKDDFQEEHFKALECIAEIITKTGNTKDTNTMDIYDVAKEMIEKEPKRFEGYYYLAVYYMEKREWNKALAELTKYKKCKKPKIYKLWLNPTLYNGEGVLRAVEKCKTALKYSTVLKPEQIIDYGKPKSTFKHGNQQYM